MKLKTIIIIISHKTELTENEYISIKQCQNILRNHLMYFVLPKSLNSKYYSKNFPEIKHLYVNNKHLSSYKNFNRFKVSPFLYRKFREYDYMLFYEPDAFVFKDELDLWMNKGYDYIGAPWFEDFDSASKEAKFIGVGNGGFSLRKISSHLKVLYSFKYVESPLKLWQKRKKRFNGIKGIIYLILTFIRDSTIRNNTFFLFNNFTGHEDVFWNKCGDMFKWFKVATIDEAIKFSFENHPEKLYELNNNELPFGCHAWEKYNIKFWKPFIENYGFKINSDL